MTGLFIEDRPVTLSIDERDIKMAAYSGHELISKMFYPEPAIKGYPVRNKTVLLYVRKRRWLAESWNTLQPLSGMYRKIGSGR